MLLMNSTLAHQDNLFYFPLLSPLNLQAPSYYPYLCPLYVYMPFQVEIYFKIQDIRLSYHSLIMLHNESEMGFVIFGFKCWHFFFYHWQQQQSIFAWHKYLCKLAVFRQKLVINISVIFIFSLAYVSILN